jgi:hypothetical protein
LWVDPAVHGVHAGSSIPTWRRAPGPDNCDFFTGAIGKDGHRLTARSGDAFDPALGTEAALQVIDQLAQDNRINTFAPFWCMPGALDAQQKASIRWRSATQPWAAAEKGSLAVSVPADQIYVGAAQCHRR